MPVFWFYTYVSIILSHVTFPKWNSVMEYFLFNDNCFKTVPFFLFTLKTFYQTCMHKSMLIKIIFLIIMILYLEERNWHGVWILKTFFKFVYYRDY